MLQRRNGRCIAGKSEVDGMRLARIELSVLIMTIPLLLCLLLLLDVLYTILISAMFHRDESTHSTSVFK